MKNIMGWSNPTIGLARFTLLQSLFVAALVSMILASSTSVIAHEGHGDEEVGDYDLDKPREVSQQTAEHIDLKFSEVGEKAIEDVVRILGVVRAKPELREVVSAKLDSQVSETFFQVGDTVERGETLANLSRADGTVISVRPSHLNRAVVVSQAAIAGRWVEKGTELYELADFSTVYVEGQVPESLLPRLIERNTDRVRVYVGKEKRDVFEGKLRYISPNLDPLKRTATVVVEVSNQSGILRGEMWVELAIVVKELKSAIVVPKSAVVVYGPMHFVFVKNGPKYQKQDINPGVTDDRYVEVLDGLFPGDEVVIQGAYSLTQIRPKD